MVILKNTSLLGKLVFIRSRNHPPSPCRSCLQEPCLLLNIVKKTTTICAVYFSYLIGSLIVLILCFILLFPFRYAEDIAKVQKQYPSEPFKFLEPRFVLAFLTTPFAEIKERWPYLLKYSACQYFEWREKKQKNVVYQKNIF